MEPKKGMLTRYLNQKNSDNSLIIFPKEISKKRVFKHAHMLIRGNGASPVYTLKEALKKAWEMEKGVVESGGVIYGPYFI